MDGGAARADGRRRRSRMRQQGFDVRRPGIATGRVERVEYHLVGDRRKKPAMVYTAAGLFVSAEVSGALPAARDRRQRERTGRSSGRPTAILDNLIADRKAVPMIVVMPHGRASNEPETITLWRTAVDRGARGAPLRPDGRPRRRRRAGPPGGRPPAGGDGRAAGAAAQAWRSSSRRTRRSSASCIGGSDSVHRVALLGAGRSRAPRARRSLDGRRPVAELRPRQPRHVRLGRRLLVRTQHRASRRSW